MKKALVTGATGFTGRYITAALISNGYHVVGLSGSAAVSARLCNMTDARAVTAVVNEVCPDIVVHLAAVSFVDHGDAEAFYKVNVFGTLNLLEALSKAKTCPKKVLIASSANVYGSPAVEVIDESICPAPMNHYAVSKLSMEYLVRTWFDRLPIIITRPFNYTGPGQDERFLIPKIVGHFRRGERVIELGNLNVSRDFSDIRDVVRAYLALLESDAHSVIVNVCSGRCIALGDVITMMNAIANYAIEVRVNSFFERTNEIPRLLGDNTLLRKLVGFVPNTLFENTIRFIYETKDAKCV